MEGSDFLINKRVKISPDPKCSEVTIILMKWGLSRYLAERIVWEPPDPRCIKCKGMLTQQRSIWRPSAPAIFWHCKQYTCQDVRNGWIDERK